MPSRFFVATALLIASCGCVPQAEVDPDLVGSWVATTGEYSGATIEFTDDGRFLFSSNQWVGTYEADGSTLTLDFPGNPSFCRGGGTLTWDYHVRGQILTADDVAGSCADRRHWEFGRISG